MGLLVAALCVAQPLAAAGTSAWVVREQGDLLVVHAPEVAAGSLLVVEVATEQHGPSPGVVWQGQEFVGHPVGDRWHVLLPVALDLTPAAYELVVRWGAEELLSEVCVVAGSYGESRLRIDPKFSKAPPARVDEERAVIDAALARRTAERRWSESFELPADGRITSPFGVRRTFNDEVKSRHRGVDIDGTTGAVVRAANDGVVVLVTSDFYFVGNAVFLDHGDGLMTVYFHLSRVDVEEGERVERGASLGGIGSSGRSTGPHLHFGVRIDGIYIDPQALFAYQPSLLLSETIRGR
jgi:murein DD-endopeptidase MepM/ murein hydrolase activator NlpD